MMMQQVETGYWICRLCGFIYKGKSPPICPACGAPATSFVPYKMMAEEKRVKYLKMDLHPIATHFAVGGAIILTLLFLVTWIFGDLILGVNVGYGGALDFFVIWQPIFTLGTFLLGLMDGKFRYKKLNTLYLRRKMFLGISMLASSILVVIFHYLSVGGSILSWRIVEFVFILVTLGCAGVLGLIGGQLTCNIVPRGQEVQAKPAAKPPPKPAKVEEEAETEETAGEE
jgi:hypothetical protein